MAKNNLANKAKAQTAGKRGRRRTLSPEVGQLEAVAGADPTPSTLASRKELVAKIADQLSPFERFLVEQRSEGRSWEAIARDIGDNVGAKALSRRFERAVQKAAKALGPKEAEP